MTDHRDSRRTTGALFVVGAARVRGGGDGAVGDVRLAGHPARARRRGAAGVRRRRHEAGLDLVRDGLDLRDPAGADAAAAGGPRPPRRPGAAGRDLVGATSVVLSLVGFLRWVFVVPPLARSYVAGDATTQAAVEAAWTAQHQFGGALLGEHLGQVLHRWSVTLCVVMLRTRVLPRWLGWRRPGGERAVPAQPGRHIRHRVPGFPVWDLAGLLGSTGWGLWVAALGVTLLRRPAAATVTSRGLSPAAAWSGGAPWQDRRMPRTIDVEERRARLARRHRLLPGAAHRRRRRDRRRRGRAALHRPGHGLPLGDAADGAPVRRGGRAGAVRRPHRGPAPRDAPHAVGGHPGRRTPDARGRDPQARRARAPPDRQAAGRERRRRPRRLARRRPRPGARGPARARADDRPRAGPEGAGAHPQDRDGAGQEVVRDGLRAHPGAAPASASRARSCAPGPPAPGSTAPTRTPPRTAGSTAGWATSTEREAARDLALRWLHAFGPGTTDRPAVVDGLDRRHDQAGAGRRGAVEVLVDGARPGWRRATRSRSPTPEPWVALLPGLDPTTMGWKERDWYLPDASADTFDRMGNAGPTLWVDGQVVGGWVQAADGEIRMRATSTCRPPGVGARERAAEVAGLLGETRFTVRFPSPCRPRCSRATGTTV